MELMLRAPEFADIKSSRGLSTWNKVVSYELKLAVDQPPLQPVQAGKANRVVAALNAPLPPNANVDSLTASIYVGDADASEAAAPTSVGVNVKADKSDSPANGNFQVAVSQAPRPRNVKLAFPGQEPFWTNGAVLTEDVYDLPGGPLQAALHAYLDKLPPPSGQLAELPFDFLTDSPGKIGVKVSLTFSLVKTQSWTNDLDKTKRVDRTLTLDFGSIQLLKLDGLTADTNPQVNLRTLALDAGGQVKPDRLLGPIALHDGHQYAIVDADRAVAQQFTLSGKFVKGSRRFTAVTALISGDAKAELYLELQPDESNYPAAVAPIARSNVKFAPPEKTSDEAAHDQLSTFPTWTVAQLSAPAELKPDIPYWIVLKGVSGVANLAIGEPPSGKDLALPLSWGSTYGNRGGQVWTGLFRSDPTPRIVALLGVVYQPGSDDQTAAIEVNARGSAEPDDDGTVAVDLRPAAQTVHLPITGAVDLNASTLAIRSHAQGSLQIANVIRTYRLGG